MLALGAKLTFLIGRAASGSLVIGLMVASIHVCLGPRLYNYPKIVLYALAVLGWWAYVDRPHRLKLVALGVLTVVAFLFRHDHGAYIGIGTMVLLAIVGRETGLPRALGAFAVYGLVAAVCVAPYLVFLHRNGGVLEHMRVGLEFSRVDSSRTELRWPRFTVDVHAPFLETAPPPPEPRPRVKVRWRRPAPSTAEQASFARLHQLTVHEHAAEGAEFDVIDESPDSLRRMVADPLVADTQNIDRAAWRVTERPAMSRWARARRAMPILRTRVMPGVLAPENAAPFVYYLFLALPIAMAFVSVGGVRGRTDAGAWRDFTRIAPIIIVTLLLNQWFLRGTLPVRLADVSVLSAALGASLLGRAIRTACTSHGLWRVTAATALIVLVGITTASAASIGAVALNLVTVTEGDGVGGLLSRARLVREELRMPGPVLAATRARSSPSMSAADYLHACLRPTDRALVIGYRPETFYFADRLFAGGHVDLRAGYVTSARDQQLAIVRMRRQSVPVVITEAKAVFESRYRSESPLLLAYLDEEYADTGDRTVAGDVLRILIRRDRMPTGIHEPIGVPCFA